MPLIRISCHISKSRLPLPSGSYGDPMRGGIELSQTEQLHDDMHQQPLEVAYCANIPDNLSLGEQNQTRNSHAFELLRRTNRLIRWCRTIGGQPALSELTLGWVGTVWFTTQPEGTEWGKHVAVTTYISSVTPIEQAVQQIKTQFASGNEPPVSDLFIIDAQQSLLEGRFRECVLLCWGAIDATFNQKFEKLVDSKLADEWPESRKYLVGNDFGLRHKMALGLRLVTGHSLYLEKDDFWTKLNTSYKNRNNIIHEGTIVSEYEAELALWVARRVVQVMRKL